VRNISKSILENVDRRSSLGVRVGKYARELFGVVGIGNKVTAIYERCLICAELWKRAPLHRKNLTSCLRKLEPMITEQCL